MEHRSDRLIRDVLGEEERVRLVGGPADGMEITCHPSLFVIVPCDPAMVDDLDDIEIVRHYVEPGEEVPSGIPFVKAKYQVDASGVGTHESNSMDVWLSKDET